MSRTASERDVAASGAEQPGIESATESVIVVPGSLEVKVTALVPWPAVIAPPVSVQVSVCPGPESEDAVSPSVDGGTETRAVTFGAGNGQATTVVWTIAVSLLESGSTRAPETSELLVSVPATDGVPTITTVAVAPRARSPRSQWAPCDSSVQEPWLGVAESTLAESVR